MVSDGCVCETDRLHVYVGGSHGWLVSRHHEGFGLLGQFEKASIVESEAAVHAEATFLVCARSCWIGVQGSDHGGHGQVSINAIMIVSEWGSVVRQVC